MFVGGQVGARSLGLAYRPFKSPTRRPNLNPIFQMKTYTFCLDLFYVVLRFVLQHVERFILYVKLVLFVIE